MSLSGDVAKYLLFDPMVFYDINTDGRLRARQCHVNTGRVVISPLTLAIISGVGLSFKTTPKPLQNLLIPTIKQSNQANSPFKNQSSTPVGLRYASLMIVH